MCAHSLQVGFGVIPVAVPSSLAAACCPQCPHSQTEAVTCFNSSPIYIGCPVLCVCFLLTQWRKVPFAKFSFQEWLSSLCDEPINWIKSSGRDFLAFEIHNLGWVFRTAQFPCKQQITARSAQHSGVCVGLLEAMVCTQSSRILEKTGQFSQC